MYFIFYINSVRNSLLFAKYSGSCDEDAGRDACGISDEVVIPYPGQKLEVKFFSIKFHEDPSGGSWVIAAYKGTDRRTERTQLTLRVLLKLPKK
jgi:hypothetical protein